jgi:hypothetical protein
MQRASKAAYAGVVNQNVNPAMPALHIGGDGLDGEQVSDIAFRNLGAAARFGDRRGGGLQKAPRAPTKDGYGAQAGQVRCNCGADTTPSASNHSDLASETVIIYVGHEPSSGLSDC